MELAKLFLRLVPDDTGFKQDATAKVKTATAGIDGNIPLKADDTQPNLVADKLKAKIAELAKAAEGLKFKADDKDARLSVLRLQTELHRLTDRDWTVKLKAEGLTKITGDILAADIALDKLQRKAGGSGGRGGIIGTLSNLLSGGSGSGGLIGAAGKVPLGGLGGVGTIAAAVPVLGALLTEATGLASGLAAAGAGLVGFGALAYPTISDLAEGLTKLSGATETYQQASETLNTAIHKSPADLADYKASLQGIEPDLRGAVKQLTDSNTQWQNLSPRMQKSVIALSDNKKALKGLLPDQKAALTALLAQGKAWDDLNPAQQTAARGLQKLGGEYDKLVTAFAPDVWKVFNAGLRIANNLLPTLLPLAHQAAGAITGLLGGLAKATAPQAKQVTGPQNQGAAPLGFAPPLSPWQKFWKQVTAESGPALTALGKGTGQVLKNLGSLLTVMSKKDVVHAINTAFAILAGTIHGVTIFVHDLMLRWDDLSRAYNLTKDALGRSAHDVHQWWLDVTHSLDQAQAGFLGFFRRVAHDLWQWNNDVKGAIDGVVHWFSLLPGRVWNWLKGLPGQLIALGAHMIGGLLDGAKNFLAGSIGGWIGKVGSSIINSVKHFFGIRSPSTVFAALGGQMMSGLLLGMIRGSAGLVKRVFGDFPSAIKHFAEKGIAWAVSGISSLAAKGVHWAESALGSLARLGGKFLRLFGIGGGGGGSPSQLQRLAESMFGAYGWGPGQLQPLIALWNQESGWRWNATNPSSGAYGIPQSLPGSKMASAGADWRTNPATQIRWGLGYIKGRYGSPAGAEGHELAYNWYDKGGFLPQGLSLALNTTGAPEPVGHGMSDGVEALLQELISAVYDAADRNAAATADGVAGALGGAAHSAGYRSLYGTASG